MACLPSITGDILNDCTTSPVGGIEQRAWIGNRTAFTFTSTDNKITNIVADQGALLYTLDCQKKGLDAGHDIVVSDKLSDKFTHFVSYPQFETTAAALLNVTTAQDLFIIVERKQKNSGGDGTFFAYGIGTGLHKSADTRRLQTDAGIRNLEYTSRAGEEEIYPEWVVLKTDYATTAALLVALVTPA